MKTQLSFLTVLLVLLAASMIAACNIFDPFDSPTSDTQLLSAARAYFDKGEFDKAAEMYAKISGDKADAVNADTAFRMVDQYGAPMSQFMISFGTGEVGIGNALTSLANHMVSTGGTPGETKRLQILEAFQRVSGITDPATRGVVRFVTAAAMVSEILSEVAGLASPIGSVTPADIVSTPNVCTNALLDCNVTSECDQPASGLDKAAGPLARMPATGTSGFTGAATLDMIGAAFKEIDVALNQEIGSGGTLGNNFLNFITTLSTTFTAVVQTAPRCARQALVQNGIGAN